MKTSKIILILIVIGTLVGQGDVRAQESGQHYIVGIANIWITPGFMEEMAALGYVEGENITYMIPSFEGVEPEQIQDSYWAQIQAMVDAGADVFVTNTDTDAVNLRERVGDIPIVFGRSDDPVATGAVQDLVTPGGTMTGNITNRPHERRLQVLTEINPATDRVYYLYGTQTGEAETVLAQVMAVAEELNIEVIPGPIADLESGLEALQNIPEGTDWLFLTPYVPYVQEFSQALLAASETYQIPISYFMFVPVQGYLMGLRPGHRRQRPAGRPPGGPHPARRFPGHPAGSNRRKLPVHQPGSGGSSPYGNPGQRAAPGRSDRPPRLFRQSQQPDAARLLRSGERTPV